MNEFPLSMPQAESQLARILNQGFLHRIPKKIADKAIVLAYASTALTRYHRYSESELNALLKEWLSNVYARVDHVTLRRHLVDYGFIGRDIAGSFYILHFGKQRSVLKTEAISVDLNHICRINAARRQQRQSPTR